MTKLIVLIPLILISLPLYTQRQLDIQGDPSSFDTVATIKVNYTGPRDVIGLSVFSEPEFDFGIAGSFFGGIVGLKGESKFGVGVFGVSKTSYGIYGKSNSDYGVYGKSDTTYGVYGVGLIGGLYGKTVGGTGVYGESERLYGVRGNSGTYIGVIGDSYTEMFPYIIPFDTLRIGVLGRGDTIGVLGRSQMQYGIGVLGRTHQTLGRSVKGVALGERSIGVLGEAFSENSTAVWGDGTTGAFFRGAGGTAIQLGGVDSDYTSPPEGDDCVIRTQKNQAGGDFILVTNDEMAIRLDDDDNSTGHFKVFNGNDVQIFSLDEGGNLTISGTYSPSSDVKRKEGILPVNQIEILEKVSSLPISEWQFKGEDIRHIGPMAQDFYAAFGLGQGDTTISTLDADGVMMAAIQALSKNQMEHAKQINEIEQTNQILQSKNNTLKLKINELSERIESLQTMIEAGKSTRE